MRFEDWDVLLFNGPHSEIGHIPLKEFKIQCQALEDTSLAMADMSRAVCMTPLMTCFMPGIPEAAPFQISIHSWAAKQFTYLATEGANGAGPTTQLWQVKVTVDGADCCIEHYPNDVAWPKVVTIANQLPAGGDGPEPLRWPRFYKSIMSQHHWDANDPKGRIKVEISEGYVKEEGGKQVFIKLMNHAIFNFQPAPMDLLQRAGLAWPNAAIFHNPIKPNALYSFGQEPAFANRTDHHHHRNMSASSMSSFQSSPSHFGGGLPPPSSFNYGPGLVPPNSYANSYANSSRSSSAYSTIPHSVLPPPAVPIAAAAQSPANTANGASQDQSLVRLPSDQLQRLLNALSTTKTTDNSMPPPPRPQQAAAATQVNGTESSGTQTSGGEERRLANNSDISMHADCPSYPGCITEDAEGCVVHESPAQEVRSKKEGAVDNSNRDFLSNVLNPASSEASGDMMPSSSSPNMTATLASSSPAISSARKRTRAETKAAAANGGSPEKVDKDTAEPARKVSKPSHDLDKEIVQPDEESMVLGP